MTLGTLAPGPAAAVSLCQLLKKEKSLIINLFSCYRSEGAHKTNKLKPKPSELRAPKAPSAASNAGFSVKHLGCGKAEPPRGGERAAGEGGVGSLCTGQARQGGGTRRGGRCRGGPGSTDLREGKEGRRQCPAWKPRGDCRPGGGRRQP